MKISVHDLAPLDQSVVAPTHIHYLNRIKNINKLLEAMHTYELRLATK